MWSGTPRLSSTPTKPWIFRQKGPDARREGASAETYREVRRTSERPSNKADGPFSRKILPKVGVGALRCAVLNAFGISAVLAAGRPLGPRVEFATCLCGTPLVSAGRGALFDSHLLDGSIKVNRTEGGSRTHNPLRGMVFETIAYASSATSAEGPPRFAAG